MASTRKKKKKGPAKKASKGGRGRSSKSSGSAIKPMPGLREVIEEFGDRHGLTPRERLILLALASGHTQVEELVDVLGRAPDTLKNQIKAMNRRTGVHSKSSLLALLLRHVVKATKSSASSSRRTKGR